MFDLKKIDIRNFFKNLKNLKNTVTESEAFKIVTLVFCGLLLLLLLLPYFFNVASLKFQIAQKVSQISGANFAIKGQVRVAIVPFPTIILEDVLLRDYKSESGEIYNLYAKSVKIRLKLSESFDGLLIKKIIFSDAVLSTYCDKNKLLEHKDKFNEILNRFKSSFSAVEQQKKLSNPEEKIDSNKISKLFSFIKIKESEFTSVKFPSIAIKNSELIFYDQLNKKLEASSINSDIESSEEKLFVKGSLSSANIESNFKFLAKFNQKPGKENSFLDIKSRAMKMRIEGNFTGPNQGIFASPFTGKISAEILELKSFYKSYISATSVISDKIRSGASPIKIRANIENNGAEIAVSDLLIDSSLVNGKGEISLSLSDKMTLIDANLDLENLDLDNIWSSEPVAISGLPNNLSDLPKNLDSDASETWLSVQQKLEQKQLEQKTGGPSSLNSSEELSNLKKSDLIVQITVKNVKYLGGELKDLSAYLLVSKDSEVLVMPLVFKMTGEGLFRLNGAIYNNDELPKFVGKFDAKGQSLAEILKWLKIESSNLKLDNLKKYSVYSDVILLPNIVNLNSLYLELNDANIELKGDLKVDNSSSKTTYINSKLHVSDLIVADYFLVSGKNTYLSPGLLVTKFLWLNNISSEVDLSLGFDSILYKDKKYPEQFFDLKFRRGYFEANNLKLNSGQTNLKGGLLIDISENNPRFEMNLNVDKFEYPSKQIDQEDVEVKDEETKSETEELAKKPPSIAAKKITQKSLFDQFYNLPSLEGFNGKISLTFDNLNLNNLPITNTNLAGTLINGDLRDVSFGSDLYNGHLDYKGMIGIKFDKTINGNILFSKVPLQPFLSDLIGINNISGITNISASITSIARNPQDFLPKLNSEIKFSANSPTIDGYGLNEMVVKMFAPKIYADDLRNPETILLNPQAKTTFKEASGVIQVNGERNGKVEIKASSTAINAILSGSITEANKKVDLLFNVIFLSGTRKKQTPINIATNLKGNLKNLSQKTNLDQVRQYLGLPKIDTPNYSNPVASPANKDANVLNLKKPIEANKSGINPAAQPEDKTKISLDKNSIEKTILLPAQKTESTLSNQPITLPQTSAIQPATPK